MICAHAYMWRKNGVVKEAIVLQRAVRIASCDFKPGKSNGLVHCSVKNAAVLCENHRERFTHIWTSPSEEEEEEEEERKTFWPSGDFLVRYFCDAFCDTGCVFCHENTRKWTVGCYNGLKVSCFGDFERFVCISIYCVSTLSLHIESTNSMISHTMRASSYESPELCGKPRPQTTTCWGYWWANWHSPKK